MRQPARHHATLCCAMLSHAAWPCLHRPVLPCALHTCGSCGAVATGNAWGSRPGPQRGGGAGRGAWASGWCVSSGGSHGAGRMGLRSVGGRSWELLPWEHWMCLQQVCLEEAGLVLTGPWQPHQQLAPHVGAALQGTGALLPLCCHAHLGWQHPATRVQGPSQEDALGHQLPPLCTTVESWAGAGTS